MNRTTHLQLNMAENDAAALAAEMFDHFSSATTMRQILGLYRNMCDTIGLRPGPLNEFYPKLKSKIKTWKAQALWKKFDARASHRVYNKGTACKGTRVLVIGAGPCGLRTAIEAQLLGAKVVVVEKRDRISRNNVLHLWPFLITDLRNLGAKKFYGKFCAGSIDHISIRQLQCILLKVALLLGVEVHEGISFEKTLEPTDGCGWRAQVSPEDHAVSHYEFDVLIGADGKRNTLEGFRRKEFRGKLAIAITANFINKKTEAEAKAEEISGVAFIFNQSFFKELYQTTGIDLENIVYYKDETHYFVMTAKKHSLIDKGVIIQDFADPAELLSPINVNTERLLDYAQEAAQFSTKYQMPNLEFAVNHYGKPDVAMFDFTSMFAAEMSCSVIVRKNYRLLQCLVGDSLLEPFWPTGSGCARGFLSSMDAAYAMKLWNNQRNSILAVLAQRESIYRLLAQTTPENLHRDIGSYTLDPATRYPNLNRAAVTVYQVKHMLNTDDAALLEQVFMDSNALQATPDQPSRRKRRTADILPLSTVLLRWIRAQLQSHEFIQNLTDVSECFTNGQVLCALINRYRPDLVDLTQLKDCNVLECNELAFKIIENELQIPRVMSAMDSLTLDSIDSKVWMTYLEQVCEVFRGEIPHVKHPKLDFADLKDKPNNRVPDFSRLLKLTSRKVKSPSGEIDHGAVSPRGATGGEDDRSRRIRKLVVDSSPAVQVDAPTRRAKKRRSHEKFGNVDRDRGIPSAFARSTEPDYQFNDRIKSMEHKITARNAAVTEKKPKDLLRAIGKIESNDWNIREIEKKIEQSKKTEVGKSREKVPKWSKEQFLQRQNKMSRPLDRQASVDEKFKDIDETIKNLDKQLKDGNILERGQRGKNKVASIAGNFGKKEETAAAVPVEEKAGVQRSNSKASGLVFGSQGVSEICHFCKQKVYVMEKISAEGLILHRACLKCHHCHTSLRLGGYAFDRDDPSGRFYCTQHYRLPAKIQRPIPKRSMMQRLRSITKNETDVDSSPKTPNAKEMPEMPRDRREGQTPERIEFENTDAMSDGEPSLENIIDENEWTDRNFGTGTEESESDISSTDESDSDSDSEEYEEAMGSPLGAQTLQLATDWIGKQRFSGNQYSDEDDDDNEFYDSSEDEGADSQTEGEELEKAREIRMQEVKLKPLPYLPTDTETEVQSDSDSSSPVVELNSATEISTDSEFEHDPIFRETPQIFIDDTHLKKPTAVKVKQSVIVNGVRRPSPTKNPYLTKAAHAPPPPRPPQPDIHIEFKPLVQVDPSVLSSSRIPLKNPRPGDYMLNKTASTEGIACKKSLELKKRYLLGESTLASGIMKSDSTSVLDSKFKNFHSNIAQCQKMLNNPISSGVPSPPNMDMNPVRENFLRHSPTNPIVTDTSSTTTATITNSSSVASSKEQLMSKNSDEKENVYGKMVTTKNDLNKFDAPPLPANAPPLKILETVNTALVENKIKDMASPVKMGHIFEPIDLITPEKPIPIIDITSIEIPAATIKQNQEFIENMKISAEIEVIDLTQDDSPVKEPAPPAKISVETATERSKNAIDSMLKHSEARKSKDDDAPPRSPIHETSIPVPTLPWSPKSSKISDLDSDSLSSASSSTTSSVDDIPHFVLESTTSPDTLPGDRFVPRLEIRDTSGELMQIDSLMIIDGKYIGDPEDLKLMKMPDGSKPLETMTISACATTVKAPPEKEVVVEKKSPGIVPPYRYESAISRKRPDLKFDTKNENKIDTLKNLPMVIPPAAEIKPIKPNMLELSDAKPQTDSIDNDKTPTAATYSEMNKSDSETEMTGPVLTETELSDWAADDAVSENFVDIEFVLNSNKGTIRRNKKSKKKHGSNGTRNTSSQPPVRPINTTAAPIVKDLDFDGIEFMDTGSEDDSCLETFSATNKAMLKNRGYVKFVDNHLGANAVTTIVPLVTSKDMYSYKSDAGYGSSPKDSIDRNYKPRDLNLPEPLVSVSKEVPGVDYIEQGACILGNDIDLKTPMNEVPPMFTVKKVPVEQPDSLLDIEEDSLVMFASQGGNTTTEDSDALTVVTSPIDSTPNQVVSSANSGSPPRDDEVFQNKSSSLVSSSEANVAEMPIQPKRKDSDECTYEDYVRKLQQKISQISNARDSIDIRKTKRKHSKGDISNGSGVDTTLSNQQQPVIDKSLSIFVNKNGSTIAGNIERVVQPPPTLTERIEEITKERTKQKDLIHDLVMDKLQSKKQLNAEKRLNRSRNRSSIFSPSSSSGGGVNNSGLGLSTPSSSLTTSNSCSNAPHFHSPAPQTSPITPPQNGIPPTPKSHFSPTSKKISHKEPRPLSDHIGSSTMDPPPQQKLMKTQSFCVYSTRNPSDSAMKFLEQVNGFSTPVPPPRRKYDEAMASAQITQTEKLRQEARARARLKSNQDLGLSPDEKIQLLRKRFNLDMLGCSTATAQIDSNDAMPAAMNKSDDMKVRERKMIASKSVNDIASVSNSHHTGGQQINDSFTTQNRNKISDFTSDPNLADATPDTHKRRHHKDPERRKSIIKAVSDFFYKKKDISPGAKDKSTSDGMFGRFRISPKSKSKSCYDIRNTGFGDKENTTGAASERSKSEDHLKMDSSKDNLHQQHHHHHRLSDEVMPPPIPPLPTNYQRSDDESCSANESREQKKLRAHTKASRQAELKRLRIAQEIQREQEEIEVKLKDLEARGVLIEKALRGEGQQFDEFDPSGSVGANDDKLLKELLEIWRNITQLKKRDDELSIRQQELQLEHRHAQLKDQLNTRLSCSRLDKSSSDVAAEGAILNEMLEIVAKRAALRSFDTTATTSPNQIQTPSATIANMKSLQRSDHPNDAFESDI